MSASASGDSGRTGRSAVGGLAWAEQTGGRLSGSDRLELLRQGLIFQTIEIAGTAASKLGLRRPVTFDLQRIPIPDSSAALNAEKLALEMRPEMLVNHSYRTYLWAAGLARAEGAVVDHEVLYVASLLHDLGLSEPHASTSEATCFTLVGARAALGIEGGIEWSRRRSELAAEAITMHMNLRVPSDAPEMHYVTAGTLLDAAGAGRWRLSEQTLWEVVDRHPREKVKPQMVELFRHQHRAHPGSRAHFYWRYFNLRLRLKYAAMHDERIPI